MSSQGCLRPGRKRKCRSAAVPQCHSETHALSVDICVMSAAEQRMAAYSKSPKNRKPTSSVPLKNDSNAQGSRLRTNLCTSSSQRLSTTWLKLLVEHRDIVCQFRGRIRLCADNLRYLVDSQHGVPGSHRQSTTLWIVKALANSCQNTL